MGRAGRIGLEQRVLEGAGREQTFPVRRGEDAEERALPFDDAEARRRLIGSGRIRGRLEDVQRPRQEVAESFVVSVGVDVVAERDEDPHALLGHELP